MKNRKILISGGTGLVGKAIVEQLVNLGNQVTILTTRQKLPPSTENTTYSFWDPSKDVIEDALFASHDAIINLAGASLSVRWTNEQRKAILNSRIDSTRLLVNGATKQSSSISHFVSTSAVGYYPSNDILHVENDAPADDFLSQVTIAWENEVKPLENTLIRSSILRVGVVLSTNGGALERLKPLFNWGLGSAVGSGKQYMSPIHIDDLASMYIYCLDQEIEGVFNATGSETITNADFSRLLAKTLGKPYFLPRVPGFILKLVLGEMAVIILSGQRASSAKIANRGFQFRYPTVISQLAHLLKG